VHRTDDWARDIPTTSAKPVETVMDDVSEICAFSFMLFHHGVERRLSSART
jgi:hypothetical protein